MTRGPGPGGRKKTGGDETGAVVKSWKNRISVALAYPNVYGVGMPNLGFQAVYSQLNALDHVVCERAFLSGSGSGPRALESGRPLADFDIIAFSVSFENDFVHIPMMLNAAGIPLYSRRRDRPLPLVMAGGVACLLNPEPLADFMDCFLIGESEALLKPFFNRYDPSLDRRALLADLARHVSGLYVPSFYQVSRQSDGSIKKIAPIADVPPRVRRMVKADIADEPVRSVVLSSGSAFGRMFLVEASRGCFRGCRFCAAGFAGRPPRFFSFSALEKAIKEGARKSDRVGLVGAALSDFKDMDRLGRLAAREGVRLSFSSLRADSIDDRLADLLRENGVKTAVIAPEAGSERMRRVINKGMDESDILSAAETFAGRGVLNLKLYFMTGLPTEEPGDAAAIVDLCRRVRERFADASREKGRMGSVTVSLNPFVPKPLTPFQWAPAPGVADMKKKIRAISNGLRAVPNIRIHGNSPREAHVQALLSRGDRRTSKALEMAAGEGGKWTRVLAGLKSDKGPRVVRERGPEERFPWEIIDSGLDRDFLRREYEKALAGRASPPCPMTDCDLCARGCMSENIFKKNGLKP
ncbi:conserved hypothetical protein [Candidatus Desulfarcum epimagneticum]|uniref:Radical SAM core domain-containing protein n=1 Tax=uncultured Desulfobacteraceae bacterium TaxID=218296 RepID=A0A484HLI1_9BACT|nr:conserved hypothetical protein [uncultured Desulfobacteraceae bacterium]